MNTTLSLLFSGFAGIVVGVIGTYFGQRKLIGMQITAANQSNEKLVKRIGDQIDLQIRGSELSAIATLLSSVNAQIADERAHAGPGWQNLIPARGKYHERLHAILAEMGRGF